MHSIGARAILAGAMNTVARGLILPIIDWARANGHECHDLFDGLPLDEAALRNDVRRIDWADYIALHERLARAVGGVDRLAELVESLPTPAVDWLLRSLDKPSQVYRMWSNLAPLLWGSLRLDVEERADGAVHLSVQLPDDIPDATVWFRTCTGLIAAMVKHLDVPRTKVEVVRIATHAAEWIVRAPSRAGATADPAAPATLAYLSDVGASYQEAVRQLEEARQRLARETGALTLAQAGTLFILDGARQVVWTSDAGRAWLAANPDGESRLRAAVRGGGDPLLHAVPLQKPPGHHLVALQDPTRDFEDRIATATEAWQLTRAQAQVLRGVVRGLSNKEIASSLGNAEATVEVHVTRLLRKAGATGRTALVTRFWGGARAE